MARLLLAPTPFVQSWNPSVLVYSLLAPACSALLLMCVISIANLSSCVIGFKWMALLGRPEWLLHCCLTECLMCIFSLLCLFTCYHHIYIVLPFCLFFFFVIARLCFHSQRAAGFKVLLAQARLVHLHHYPSPSSTTPCRSLPCFLIQPASMPVVCSNRPSFVLLHRC